VGQASRLPPEQRKFGADRFINEFTIWKPIYAGAASVATLLY